MYYFFFFFLCSFSFFFFFFFNDTATTEIYTLSLHDALPLHRRARAQPGRQRPDRGGAGPRHERDGQEVLSRAGRLDPARARESHDEPAARERARRHGAGGGRRRHSEILALARRNRSSTARPFPASSAARARATPSS